MKRWWHIALIFLAFSCFIRVSGAVENCPVEGTSFDGKPYHIALSPTWTDKSILHALGLDIRKTKMTKSVGPDGEQRVYLLGRTTIDIVRSSSTGIYVTLHIKDNDTYVEWELPRCQADTSLREKANG